MVIDFSAIDINQRPLLKLKNMSGRVLGILGDALNISAEISLNDMSTLSFDYPACVDGSETLYYDQVIGLRIVELENYGQFILMSPSVTNDGIREVKSCTAYSLEYEFNLKKISLDKGTYQFYGGENSIIGRILEKMPSWSVGFIDTDLYDVWRTFEVTEDTLYNFIKSVLQSSYSCIFNFNTINRQINVISTASVCPTQSVYLSLNNLLKEVVVTEDTESVVTALDVNGAEGVNIRSVNPLGTNKIYNLDYFMTTDNFPQATIDKWNEWKEAYTTNSSLYYSKTVERIMKTQQLVTEKAALASLQGELSVLENQKAVRIQSGEALEEINNSIEAYTNTSTGYISAKNAVIDTLVEDIAADSASLLAINNETSLENTFDGYICPNCNELMTRNGAQELSFPLYVNGKYIVFDGTDKLLSSTDLQNWSVHDTNKSFYLYGDFAYGNGVYVAVDDHTSFYSSDGLSWSVNTMPNYNWCQVVFGNGVFVAVADAGLRSSPKYAVSSNGRDWEVGDLPFAGTLFITITYGNGKFIVSDPNTDRTIAYSSDGLTWNTVVLPVDDHSHWFVRYVRNAFYICYPGVDGVDDHEAPYIYRSVDGVNWSTINFTDVVTDVGYANGKYYAYFMNTASNTSCVKAYSLNGIDGWVNIDDPVEHFGFITAVNEELLLHTNLGEEEEDSFNILKRSTDGSTWSDDLLRSVAYSYTCPCCNTTTSSPEFSEMVAINRYIIEESIEEPSFVAPTAQSYSNIDVCNGYDTANISISGSAISQVGTTNYYSFKNGDISISPANGSINTIPTLAAKIIRGCLEIKESSIVLTAYLSAGTISDDSFGSGCLTITGSFGVTPSVQEEDAEIVMVDSESHENYLFFTKNISEYQQQVVEWNLYDYGADVLQKLSTPSYNFTISSGNFLSLEDFSAFKNSLALGRRVYLDVKGDGESVLEPILTKVSVNIDDLTSFDLEFGNRYSSSDSSFALTDLLEQSVSMGKTVNSSKYSYNYFRDSGASTSVKDYITSALDVAKQKIMSSGSQNITWDDTGIRLCKKDTNGNLENSQVWLNNNSILFTTDGWNTAQMAIGSVAEDVYGVVADALVGKIIAGNSLTIEASRILPTGSSDNPLCFQVNGAGVKLYNGDIAMSDGSFGMLISPTLGVAMGNNDILSVNSDHEYTGLNDNAYELTSDTVYNEGKQYYLANNGVYSRYTGGAAGWASNHSILYESKCAFRLTPEGNLSLKGTVEAASGSIGGWNINSNTLKSGNTGIHSGGDYSYNGSPIRFWAGDETPSSAQFIVNNNGDLKAANGQFSGTITGDLNFGNDGQIIFGNSNYCINKYGVHLRGFDSDDLDSNDGDPSAVLQASSITITDGSGTTYGVIKGGTSSNDSGVNALCIEASDGQVIKLAGDDANVSVETTGSNKYIYIAHKGAGNAYYGLRVGSNGVFYNDSNTGDWTAITNISGSGGTAIAVFA